MILVDSEFLPQNYTILGRSRRSGRTVRRWVSIAGFRAYRFASPPYYASAIRHLFVYEIDFHLPTVEEILAKIYAQTRPRRHSKPTVLGRARCRDYREEPVVVVAPDGLENLQVGCRHGQMPARKMRDRPATVMEGDWKIHRVGGRRDLPRFR